MMFTMSIPNVLYHIPSFSQNFPSPNLKPRSLHYHTSSDLKSRWKRTSFCTNPWSDLDQSLNKTTSTTCPSRHKSLPLLQCSATSSECGDDEGSKEALVTVLKLYTAIKNRNIRELSEIVCDECRCFCNFLSFFQPLHGKQQVVDLFIYVIKILGNNIELVVKPTFNDGMNIGVSWKLEWSNTNVTLGKGFSFHICHQYHGKVLIRNVEMFMEPLIHVEPIRLKIMEVISSIACKMSLFEFSKDNRRKLGFAIFIMVLITIWICQKA